MDLIIFFDVKNETLISRLLGRAAAAAVKRADDNEETIKKRIEIFNEKNGKIVDHYKDKCLRVYTLYQFQLSNDLSAEYNNSFEIFSF